MLQRKFTKWLRRNRWQHRPASDPPLVWHSGRPNFGDDINPEFFARVAGRPFRWGDPSLPHLLGAGSILERGNANSIVMGSGLLHRPTGTPMRLREVVAVRGELTAAHLGASDVPLGDPVVLIDQFVQRSVEATHRVGVAPHVLEVDRFRRQVDSSTQVIDVRRPAWEVVRQIGACELVLSQSLHGLIVADALGVPNVWLAPSGRMAGGTFKFEDYYSTTDRAKSPVVWRPSLPAEAGNLDAFVSSYRHDKAAYLDALRDAVARFSAGRSWSRAA